MQNKEKDKVDTNYERILNLIAYRVHKSHDNSIVDLEDKQLNDIFASNVALYIKLFSLTAKKPANQEESFSNILSRIQK